MASDEDNFSPEDCLPNSNIGGLILKINKMLKKPVIDFDLDETLDSFLNQLNDSQRYLSNGIFNVKFAEAGLFLQSSAALYSKKVDLLWDNALEYQMQLCSYNKSGKENAEESTKIVQKMNRNKRKKIMVQNGDTTIYVNENLTGIVDRCFKILEWCDTTPYYEELKDRWKAFRKRNKRIKRFIYCEVPNDQASNNQDCNTQLESAPDSDDDEEVVVQREQYWSPTCDIYFPINQNVDDVKTGEKLCNYGDMYINSAASCLESIEYSVCNSTNHEDIPNNYNSDSVDNNENTLSSRSSDLLLQAYLRQRHFKFRTLWSQELGDHFEALQQSFSEESHSAETSNQSIHSERGGIVCQNNSYVNLTRLPEELMAEYLKENDLHVRNIIQDLLLKQTQPEIEAQSVANAIKKGSERISNADSLFVDGTFNEEHSVHTDVPYVSQQSNADSGIFCNTMEGLSGIADNEEQVTNTGADSGIFCSVTESIVDTTPCDEHTDAPNTSELSIDCIEHGDISQDDDDIGHDTNDDIGHDNNHDVEPIILEQLNQNINLEVGRNETVESIEANNLPPFLPIHSKSIIKPVKDTRIEKQNIKRKLQKDENSEETPKRRKSQKFRWLKTTSASLAQFEKFFVKNYAPESGEVEEDWIAPTEEDSDETDSISADLGVPEELDETNENLAAITVDSVDITEKTSETSEQHVSLQVQEKDSMAAGEESTFDCVLQNSEADVEVPNITSCTNEPECDTTQVDEGEIEDDEIAGPSNSAAVPHDFSSNRSSEMEALQRLRAVNEWRRFIEPKLQEAERNANFDIHEYGTHIMDAIPPNENLNFCNIAQGKQASEVARLFLASLQLANTYNVELIAPRQGELANDKFELKLLTRERYHEHLDEYEAPSENTFREKLARVQALKPSAPLHSTPKRYSSTSKYKAKRQRLS